MANLKRQDIISAADTAIGFDYQFYYYFYLVLDLRHGEKIGIEVKDDVHIDLANGKTILIQVKHTLQTTKKGDKINLTERDKDLWKTVSNWVKIINEQTRPEEFVQNTKFKLVSNKEIYQNPFIINLSKLCNNEIKVIEFKRYLKTLYENTKDNDICNYIEDLKKLKAPIIREFAKQIDFQLSQDDLIVKIKERLLEKIHIKDRIDDVYTSLHSELRDNNYLLIKSNEKTEISFEEFNKKFGQCFKVALSTKLPIREYDFIMPSNPENQLFIKQLIEIEDISSSDKDEIIAFTTQMLQLYNNLKSWEEAGDLLPSDRKKFDKESIAIWKNSFRSRYRVIKRKIVQNKKKGSFDIDVNDIALDLIDEMRKQILAIDDTILTTELSNGQFYLLTERKNIGWHIEWENKYRK